MKVIFVLAEHRQGKLRDITGEILCKGKELASKIGAQLTAILLGYNIRGLAEEIAPKANLTLVVEDKRLENFNSELYQRALSSLIREHKPSLTLIGHTAFGMDLAPSLAAELDLPLTTDCIELDFDGDKFRAIRQVYGGKINAEVSLPQGGMVTLRPGASPVKEYELGGEIKVIDSPLAEDAKYKRFLEYIEAAAGGVDITQADILVAVGRGIQDKENISIVEGLAESLGGVLACSRPIVDKKWLPKNRQVGTSGKTVKPKVYIAIGISGAFQHIAGMQTSHTIIAINKDPRAPIFKVAHYGIVDDLFKVVPVLKDKIKELKAS